MGADITAYGLPLIALGASLAVMWLDEREASAAPPPVSEVERPVARPGCRGCSLASEAGDYFLRRHLERECAA